MIIFSNQIQFRLALILLLLSGLTSQLIAQSLPAGFASNEVQTGYTVPIGAVFSPNGQQLFVWEKAGRIFVSNWNGTTYVRQNTPVLDISDEVGDWSDGGFLSACLDPGFSTNGLIYLYYVVDRHHLLYYGTNEYEKGSNEYYNASITRVTRYQVIIRGESLVASDNSRKVLIGESKTTGIPMIFPSHVGGKMVFGRDSTLLISTGDNSYYDGADVGSHDITYFREALNDGIMRPAENVGAYRAQLTNSMCGKVLRIDPKTGDGVSSNPFYDAANPRAAQSRVWTMGLRNPYRISVQPNTGSTNPADGNPGTLLIGDVGWATAEEINVVDKAGLNCGWPLYEGMTTIEGYYGPGQYLHNLDEAGQPTFATLCLQPTSSTVDPNPARRRFTHARPALDWLHNTPVARVPAFEGNTPTFRVVGSAGAPSGTPFSGNAATGSAYYTDTKFPAAYQNSYFFADYGQNWIRNLVMHDDGDHQIHEVREFAPAGSVQNIVDIEVNPLDGSLFCVSTNGPITRISYGGNQPPVARPTADITSGASPLPVQFSSASSTDPEGYPLLVHWDFGDGSSSDEANPQHTFTSNTERPFTVSLTVTDAGKLTHTSSLTIALNSTAPTAHISSPADGSMYPADKASTYTLTADVTGSNLTYEWQVALLHNTHEHPEPVLTEVSPQIQISPVGCSTTDTYSYRVSLKVTNKGGLSATTSVRIYPDCPAVALPFSVTGVTMVSCETLSAGQRQIAVTPQYSGLNGQSVTVSVINEMSPTTAPGPYVLKLYTDNPTINLRAEQSGTAGTVSFAYNWLAACNGTVVIPPPIVNPPHVNQAPTVSQPIASQQTTVGQPFSLIVPASTFADPNGDALTYAMTNLPDGLLFNPATATLSGNATTAGQMTLTLTATDPGNLSVSTSFLLTVSPPTTTTTTPPTTTTTTATTFAITGVTTVSCETLSVGQRQVTFLPQYSGLTGQAINVSVIGEMNPTTNAGPYTLRIYTDNPTIRLQAQQNGTAGTVSFAYNWLAACNGTVVSPPPIVNPPATNQAPTVSQLIASQQTTVGQLFSLIVPASTFSDPNGDPLTYAMTNLPDGLFFNPATATLSGNATTAGQTTLMLTATDPGNLSASTSFLLTVSPPTTTTTTPPTTTTTTTPTTTTTATAFAITGVTTVSCETLSVGQRQVTFLPQYSGLTGQAINVSVIGEMNPTTNAGPYTLRIYTDNPTIRLQAQQSGTTGTVSFAYNWLAACNGTVVSPPPIVSQPPVNQAPTVSQPIASQQTTVGQLFSLIVPASTFADPNGDALTYAMTNLPDGLFFNPATATLSGNATTAGQTTLTLTATDPGNLSVSTSFLLTVSPPTTTTTPPTTTTTTPTTTTTATAFGITGVTTVSCEVMGATQRRLTFTPQYSGLNGQAVTFSVINEMSPTTGPGPYVLTLYTDNPTINLRAEQSGTSGTVSFAYNWAATCTSSNARLSAGQGEGLTVRVLGNPVLSETADVELRGATGQAVRMTIFDGQGRLVSEHLIPQAASVEQHLLRLARPAGIYLLHVSTPTEQLVLKLLKQ